MDESVGIAPKASDIPHPAQRYRPLFPPLTLLTCLIYATLVLHLTQRQVTS